MNMRRFGLTLASLFLAVSTANAALTFSNVMVHGSLSSGASFTPGTDDIDFQFPNAFVGDGTDPERRLGNIIITFEATSNMGAIDRDLVAILGALDVAGSGTIYFNEVVEDLVVPGVIAAYNRVLDDNTDLPLTDTILFSRPTTRFKVKKTLVLTAVDTPAIDLANVSLVEQRFVPEPAALALLMLGLPLMRRNR
ncbi:MAG: hypothetical protein AB7Q17_13025 [Phycisphaerae bacterium]